MAVTTMADDVRPPARTLADSHRGWAIWITGLPGSGKSAIARTVAARLMSEGEAVTVLEMDAVRKTLTPSPTYSNAEREAVYRALVYIGAAQVQRGHPVIFDATGHRRAWRDLARETIPCFAEVQLHCPVEVCRQREAARPRGHAPAGIYARSAEPGARVPGVNVEYEPALSAELHIDTVSQSVDAAAAAIVAFIRTHLWPRAGSRQATGADDLALARQLLLTEGTDEQRAISERAQAWVARHRMVDHQIEARGVSDPAVLRAMRAVPRERFVDRIQARHAYEDRPLPIGEGQTISQPYIVAAMTEAVRPRPGERALEIGTGSGYAAAVLSEIVAEVDTIERVKSLAESAEARLRDLGYTNVHVHHGDGSLGWSEHAPYDEILVTASGPDVPDSLLAQLAIGGRLVMPVGPSLREQRLVRVHRTGPTAYRHEWLEQVAFVPLIGAEGWEDEEANA
jgi:protein-L-isoaspartate(D-aspartate) O-methyltransferase